MSSACELTDEQIDSLKLPRAIQLCKQLNIDIADNPPLYEIKQRIKAEHCEKISSQTVLARLENSTKDDKISRKKLAELFSNVIEYTRTILQMKDPIVDEIKKIYPDICETLRNSRQVMADGTAPVLVLGETGSGKSTFINILLGDDYLPCSILSNTHVVCEIHFSGDKSSYAMFEPFKGSSTDLKKIENNDREQFKKELGETIQKVDENKRAVYKLAKIYLPCDILKSGLVIVDSPGVGESQEMTDLVLNYILNASAFIYIVDSTNAGGMQARVQELVVNVYKKSTENFENNVTFRPECAMFICNKWDEVRENDRKDVLHDTQRKIKDIWVGCTDEQIITFSASEAAYIQRRGRLTCQFKTILQRINALVPIGLEIVVQKGYRLLEQYIQRALHCFKTHLHSLDDSLNIRMQQRTKIINRLNELKGNLTAFFDAEFKKIEDEIDQTAANLGVFITKQENMINVCKFSMIDLPRAETWEKAAIEVRHRVYQNLRELIQKWEKDENYLQKIAQIIEQDLRNNFPTFEAELCATEANMVGRGNQTYQRDYSVQDDVDYDDDNGEQFIPNILRKQMKHLNTGAKVALGVGLAPVILVGMIIRLPLFTYQILDRMVTDFMMDSTFQEAGTDKNKRKETFEKYARKVVKSISDKLSLRGVIKEDMQPLFNFLIAQKLNMEKQIQDDLDLLKNLKEEQRNDEEVRKVYEPLTAKFEIYYAQLEHFQLMTMPTWIAKWNVCIPNTQLEKDDILICDGNEARVFQARSCGKKINNVHEIVSVRRLKTGLKPNNVKRYKESLEAYRLIKREEIVKCFGVWRSDCEWDLYQVLEPLQCSLRNYSYLRKPDFLNNKTVNFVNLMIEILSGLNFLHEKHLVHYDLSMDTVAVDLIGRIKLTNISTERYINVEPEFVNGKIQVGKYIHMSSKFFYNSKKHPKENEPAIYHTIDDMYGAGTIMWELWMEKSLVDINMWYDYPPLTDSSNTLQNQRSSSSLSDLEDLSFGNSNIDKETFLLFLKQFRPSKEHFTVSTNMKQVECWVVNELWETISKCLNVSIRSSDLLKYLQTYVQYPPLTLVEQANHF